MTITERPYWHTPAVRHLAWLCEAPSLINTGPVFSLADYLPPDTQQRLQSLDQSPSPLLSYLGDSQSWRLGQYFENLYHFLLEHILEWPVLLRNAAVRERHGRTLGELDFIVRNPLNDELQHHEIAVKFYLGFDEDGHTRWYGPNAHDRLDLKTRRLLDHQCRMTEREETQALLASVGLDGPVTPVVFMPGNLFYPQPGDSQSVVLPHWTGARHERGHWIRHSEVSAQDTTRWTPLRKPHWLGCYQTEKIPDYTETEQAMAAVAETGKPRLFAEMAKRSDGQGYDEVMRCFVMPENWPEPALSDE
ncbi:DUF1853 family protein [Marinobacter caseinilyticus]|uniref:DUF1853 family protein n=1 Tax=Marinobacter caseinilyticus TaxID=2692195 RepID=UPI001409D631|nr:DUF1853 family protein [Marinobacter caseinilyticus]